MNSQNQATHTMSTPDDQHIRTLVLDLASRCEPQKSLCPSKVAMAIKGNDEKQWRTLMKPIRRVVVDMALKGEVAILRKSKPVDPTSFKGLYRIVLALT